MVVSDKYRYVYFAPSKVGSNTIAFLLKKYLDGRIEGPKGPKLSRSWPNDNHHAIVLPREYEDYYIFTSVRNPYMRCLSLYNFLFVLKYWGTVYKQFPEEGAPFDRYIDWITDGVSEGDWRIDVLKRSIKSAIYDQPHDPAWHVPMRVDHFIHIENLEEEFKMLPFQGVPDEAFKTKYNSAKEVRQKQFPEHLADKFYEHFKEDFESFGYSREVPGYSTSDPKIMVERKSMYSDRRLSCVMPTAAIKML